MVLSFSAYMEEKNETKQKNKDYTPKPRRELKRNTRRRRRRGRTKSEFDHRVIDIRRVTRVVAGGRRFSFSVVVVAGDRKGKVGVGIGKASDTALAIEKALRDAKKKMITLNLTDAKSLPHEVEAKYGSARVKIFPSPRKGGATAGGAVRNILELGGIKDIGAKILSRSKNKLNNAQAAIKAISVFAK